MVMMVKHKLRRRLVTFAAYFMYVEVEGLRFKRDVEVFYTQICKLYFKSVNILGIVFISNKFIRHKIKYI